LYRALNTDDGMLPQSRPLESRVADNRGAGRNGSGNRAAMQQSRGESSANAKAESSPASAENGVSRVFVLDKRGKPLMPCHPARARKLLAKDRARVHQQFPFTIRLIERYGHKCVYCDGLSKDPILEIEHFVPKNPAKGPNGTDRIKNLVIGCRTCNLNKNNYQPEQWAEVLGESQKKIDQTRFNNLNRLLEGKRPSLNATAAVNATRNAIFFELRQLAPVECSTGGRTKYNRYRFNIPKTHCLDAACTGKTNAVVGWKQSVLLIKAMGRGSYQRTRVNAAGFPRGYLMRKKAVHGFATGDIVKADVPKGKKQGTYIGRVAVRKTGSFNIQTKTGTAQGISWRYCQIISRQNGYNLAIQNSSPT